MLPEDLVKFGMIPEFIGRMPMIGAVRSLDADSLVRILTEPKNALVRQYQKVFEFEDVELEFETDGLQAIADLALLHGTGARGLRAILEEVLLNTMYDLPGRTDVGRVVIDAPTVREKTNPTLVPARVNACRPPPPRRELIRFGRIARSEAGVEVRRWFPRLQLLEVAVRLRPQRCQTAHRRRHVTTRIPSPEPDVEVAISAVRRDEPHHLADAPHRTVVERDDTTGGEHPVEVEEVEQRVVERVPAVDVRELDRQALADELGKRQVVDIFDETVVAVEACAAQVEQADVAPVP